jgi:tetratricopeptide (TPR) repeat protein
MMAPAAATELMPVARAAEPPVSAPAATAPVAREPSAAKTQAASAEEEPSASAKGGGRQTRENARRADLLCNQGNDLKNKRMLPTARVRYLEALRLYDDYPRALAGLTQVALSAGDSGEALKYGKQLVKARPGQAPYQLLLGDAYRAAHDEKAARDAYKTALRMGSRAAKQRLGK